MISAFTLRTLTFILWGSIGNNMFSKFISSLEAGDHNMEYMVLALLCWVGGEISSFCGKTIHQYIYPQLEKDVRMVTFDYIQRYSQKYFHKYSEGYIENCIDCLAEGAREVGQSIIEDIGPQCFFVVFQLIIISLRNPLFGLLFTVWIFMFGLLFKFLAKTTVHYAELHNKTAHERTEKMIDVLRNNKPNQVLCLFNTSYTRVNETHEKETNFHRKYIFFDARNGFILGLLTFCLPGIGVYGLIHILFFKGLLNLADVIFIANSSFWLIHIIAEIFGRIAFVTQSIGQFNYSLSCFQEGLGKDFLSSRGELICDHIDRIEFNNVSYSTNNNFILQNCNLTIEAGDHICIIGPSGIGKTTILDLIIGTILSDKGKVTINGKKTQAYSLESLANRVTYISQNNGLFDATIRENLQIMKPGATEEEMIEALKKVGLSQVVQERGLDFRIGVGGCKLSGGQAQRLSIAQAFMRRPQVYLLDEITSALDRHNTQIVLKSMLNLMEKNTILITVDHSGLWRSICNKIIFFTPSNDIVVNTNEYLMKNNMEYRNYFAEKIE